LGAAFDRDIRRWREQDVNVIGHDDEGVKLELASVAIAEKCGDNEFGGCAALEEATTLLRHGSQDVGLGFEAHVGGRVPGAEAPCFSMASYARTEVRAYLRSKSKGKSVAEVSVMDGAQCVMHFALVVDKFNESEKS
jgi:hypothetical protein